MEEIVEKYMQLALEEAQKAPIHNDIPIGCVIVDSNGDVLSKSHNEVELRKDSTAHAELLAIKDAQEKIDYKHLLDCSIYVTLEPCSMCSGAIVLSRLKNLYYGAVDQKTGASGSLYTITNDKRLNHRCNVQGGILENDCSKLIVEFFKTIREKNG